MGMYVYKLANSSPYPGNPTPTISIEIGEDGWNEAYANWKSGKNPTDSQLWKQVVAWTKFK